MWIAMLAVVAAHSCQTVDGDQILMSDLAKADARFAAAAPTQVAGFAPQPGATRIFWPGELIHLAERNGIPPTDPFQQICFQVSTHLISQEDVTAAVRVWAPEPAHVEVLEQSRFPAPPGRLLFDKPQISQEGRDGSMLLRGYVLFHGSQRFPVWARVRIRVKRMLVVAAADMNPGDEVTPHDVVIEERETGIAVTDLAAAPSDLVGRLAKTRIRSGAPLLLTQFEKGNDVVRGSTVQVEVRDGAAHLLFDARVETNGRTGDLVSVMNPANSKVFKARVVGKNSVLVTPGPIAAVLAKKSNQEVSQQ